MTFAERRESPALCKQFVACLVLSHQSGGSPHSSRHSFITSYLIVLTQ